MANPINKIKTASAGYKMMDAKDKKRFWVDGILNNALYILMALFVIYTASVKPNFLTLKPSCFFSEIRRFYLMTILMPTSLNVALSVNVPFPLLTHSRLTIIPYSAGDFSNDRSETFAA